MSEETMKFRTCIWSPPGDHPVGCGVILTVKDGKLEKVEGDPDHPITGGRLCPRCLALKEAIDSPTRLRHPMKRAREDRGYDKWEQVTWEEAYDMIEAKARQIIEETGPEAIFTATGTGRESTMYAPAYASMIFGSPNQGGLLSGASCYGPRCTIANWLLGAGYPELDYAAFFPDRYDDPRYEVPKYILIWGKNPIYSNPDGFFGHAVVDLMKRGSKLIVLDPRVTWLASRAEFHLQLRPGTDAAIGLAMLNVIINEDLYDHDFVENWCYGFDALAERVQDYTPAWAAEVAWVPEETIIGAARALATSHPSSGLWGLAVDQSWNGVQSGHCFIALMAITGNLDVPGGITLSKPSSFIGKWRYDTLKYVTEEANSRRIVDLQGRYRLKEFGGGANPNYLGDSIMAWLEMENPPYPLRMCWLIGENTISCITVQPQRWIKLLNKLEFIVATDVVMNPTMMALADLVLPLSMSPEHEGVVIPHFGRSSHFVGAMNKCLDAGDTKSDLEILADMTKRMHPDLWPYEKISDFFTEQLQTVYPWGFDELSEQVVVQQDFEYRKYATGKLRADGEPGFQTMTGKVELKCTMYPSFGVDALPYYEEPKFSPYTLSDEDKEKYPFVLTTGGRNLSMFHSEHRQLPSMRAINMWPRVTINPETARAKGIESGDWVKITNQFGTCYQRALIRETIDPRVVHAEHAWWFPEQDGEAPNLFGVWKANVNTLLPTDAVGVSGYGAPYKNVVCNIEKATPEEVDMTAVRPIG